MIGEVDSEHVPDLSLVPVGGLEHWVAGLDGGQFVGVGLYPDSGVEAEGQQVVDDLKF